MFGLGGKKSKINKLQKKYDQLMKEAFNLSRSDRKKSDEKTAEAQIILKKMESLSNE